MTCSSCGEHPKKKDNSFTKAVVEINNPETLTLLRKVVIPASLGDEESVPPAIGKYHNVLLYYETNHHSYLYSSDGIPTLLEAEVPQEVLDRITNLETGLGNEIINREGADTTLQENIDAEAKTRGDEDAILDNRLTTVEGIASTAVQPAAINKVVMTDIALDANTSTTTVQIDGAKENLLTGAQTTKNLPLPVASTVQAGVMNSSTFDAISNNTSDINALMNGAVAITGLSASPSQSDLTTAWEAETGLTTLMNRAGIYDVTNDKVWTYYTNSNTWYAASNSAQVTINTFTNASEGTIKGSTNVGQVFAENDGTGSINGWDVLSNSVADNTANKLASANLTVGNGLTAATTGSGASTAIDIAFADKAVNTNIWTASNLSPATDDLAGWQALLGAEKAVYWTAYAQEGCFDNQPSKYGYLETVIAPTEIYQRWHTQANGGEFYRSGNSTNGWFGHNRSGKFRPLDASGWEEPTVATSYFRRTNWVKVWDYYKNSTPVVDYVDGTYNSPGGNDYGFEVVNYRTGGCITSGASKITHFRAGALYVPTTIRNASIGVRGLANNSNAYFYCYSGYNTSDGTSLAPISITINTGNGAIASPFPIGSRQDQNTFSIEYEGVRNINNWWHLTGTIYGQRVVANFGINCLARGDGHIPGIYFTGTANNKPAESASWFEIDEPINY